MNKTIIKLDFNCKIKVDTEFFDKRVDIFFDKYNGQIIFPNKKDYDGHTKKLKYEKGIIHECYNKNYGEFYGYNIMGNFEPENLLIEAIIVEFNNDIDDDEINNIIDKIKQFILFILFYRDRIFDFKENLNLKRDGMIDSYVYFNQKHPNGCYCFSAKYIMLNKIGQKYLSIRELKYLLYLFNINAKINLANQLLFEAKVFLHGFNFKHVIINCCTICEIVFSKLIVDKLTKNGSKKEDIEKILNNINGIAALRKLLKEFEIETIKADFSNLAGLRNKAAHMGISPKNIDCNKYIKVCEELLQYHRIKFYEI